MARDHELTRRRYLRAATAGAAMAGAAGCLGGGGGGGSEGNSWRTKELATVPAESDGALYEPDESDETGETVNHLTWTGYDASNVQDPFREQFDCQTQLDLFTSNPKAFNRLESGEWEQFHQATLDMAWIPRLVEAGLIRPIDYESWKPYTFDQYIDLFKKQNGYKYAFVNEDDYTFDVDGTMYGAPQRFGWASFVVNTDEVAADAYSSYDAAWFSS
ncbi:hypothetical protein [Haloplanus pelagicus]|jgi:spermidine/putrescine transport system substrate-binding protein|uniref:hypothetical protein n=1 Tax=Haloplanus pelagicus TaxID=2949995 RepID=UPI00203C8810|nr:hypothetical protein [Haloplanus sp. HW8-1]